MLTPNFTYNFLVIKGLLVHFTNLRLRTLDLDKPISRSQVSLEKIPTLNSFFFFLIFIGVQLIYNVVLLLGVQQSESVIHIHISTLFQILFPYRPLQSTEQSSLCYTVGPYQLSILHIVVCICQSQSPTLSLPHPRYPLVTTSLFPTLNS